MIKKMKLKFIMIAGIAVVVVLFIVLGLVNGINYYNNLYESYQTLEVILDNEGFLPASQSEVWMHDIIFTEDSQFEERYFYAIVDGDDSIIMMNMDFIASLKQEDVDKLVKKVMKRDDYRGLIRMGKTTYCYMRRRNENGFYDLAVLNFTPRMMASHNLLRFSLTVGLASLLLFILIISIAARKAIEPMANNIQAQKQFITNASHELKTPLAVISANVEVIEMMEGKNEWTESTLKQVSRMSELISRLVVLSRLQEKEQITLSDVDFSEVAEEAVQEYGAVICTDGKNLEKNLEKGLHVLADRSGLRELVSILTDNAAKYCDDKGTVRVNLTRKGKTAVLTVANDYADGAGVDYSRFFERFYREDQSHNSEKKGFGIGLSMAESITEMFRGKIGAFWKDGVITFQVCIPIDRVEKNAKIDKTEKSEKTENPAESK